MIWNYIGSEHASIEWGNKHPNYLKVINKVFKYELTYLGASVSKSSNLYGRDSQVCDIFGSRIVSNLSEKNGDGNRLKSLKELFMSLKNMKVIKEGTTETLNEADSTYYLITQNFDYADLKGTDIYYLNMFINSGTYHIYVPKYYYEPVELLDKSIPLVEYEPNESDKVLIENIIKAEY